MYFNVIKKLSCRLNLHERWIDRLMGRQNDLLTGRQTARQIDRQGTDRQAGRKTDRQARVRHTVNHTDRQIDLTTVQ